MFYCSLAALNCLFRDIKQYLLRVSNSGPIYTYICMHIFRISMMHILVLGLGRDKNQRHARSVANNITGSHLPSADCVLD